MRGMAPVSSDTLLLDPSKISHFVVDWDETVTNLDTMHLLGAAAYDYHDTRLAKEKEEEHGGQAQKTDQTKQANKEKASTDDNDKTDKTGSDEDDDDEEEEEEEGFQPRWDYFVRGFLTDYSQYSRSYSPDLSKTPLDQELDFLNGLRHLEYESARRAERAGLFKGVTNEHFAKQARNVRYRNGWWDLVKKLSKDQQENQKENEKGSGNDGPLIVVLSVNWSSELIKKAIDLNFPGHNIRIFCNKIDFETGKLIQNDQDSAIKSNGNNGNGDANKQDEKEIIGEGKPLSATEVLASMGDIRTAADKKQVIKLLKQEAEELFSDTTTNNTTHSPKCRNQVWYFGDSSTDTMALMEADRGVVVGKKKTFDRMTKELQIPNLHFISDWTMVKLVGNGGKDGKSESSL